MTTNHRPALESKKGKIISIKDSIQHARSLTQHSSIKYRSDLKTKLNPAIASKAIEDLQKELLEDEKRAQGINKDVHHENGIEQESVSHVAVDKESFKSVPDDVSVQELNIALSSEKENEDDHIPSSCSDYDSDSDTESLIKELDKLKKEKQEKKENLVITGNETMQPKWPNTLANFDDNNKKFKVKKSWRKASTFSKLNNSGSKNKEVNNKGRFIDDYIQYS